MSANDGGPVLRVERAEIPKPDIRRGAILLQAGEMGNPASIRVGERITFTRRVEQEYARRFAITYHGVEVVRILDPSEVPPERAGIYVDVSDEDVVTWQEI